MLRLSVLQSNVRVILPFLYTSCFIIVIYINIIEAVMQYKNEVLRCILFTSEILTLSHSYLA